MAQGNEVFHVFFLYFEGAGETEEEMTTMGGFLQFDFNIIKMATDEFSDENKVGEGGFGAVYKVITYKGFSFIS